MAKVNNLELKMALDSVSIAKGQSVGMIPIEEIHSGDYVERAIQDARKAGADYEDLRRAVKKGLTGRPNPYLN